MQPHQLHSQGTSAFIEWVGRSAVVFKSFSKRMTFHLRAPRRPARVALLSLLVENFLKESPKGLPFVPLYVLHLLLPTVWGPEVTSSVTIAEPPLQSRWSTGCSLFSIPWRLRLGVHDLGSLKEEQPVVLGRNSGRNQAVRV